MILSFIILSSAFLLLSNSDSFFESPVETGRQIFEIEANYILHPGDTAKMFIESGKSLLKIGKSSRTNLGIDRPPALDREFRAEPSEIEELILVQTNKERKSFGLGPLVWDDKLALIARNHSLDMIQRNFFSHNNPDGQGPTERFSRMFGYTPEKEVGPGEYIVGVGENLGQISSKGIVEGCGPVSNFESIAECQVHSWMESPGHRANILDQKYTNLGVGAVSGDGTYYITQVFW